MQIHLLAQHNLKLNFQLEPGLNWMIAFHTAYMIYVINIDVGTASYDSRLGVARLALADGVEHQVRVIVRDPPRIMDAIRGFFRM